MNIKECYRYLVDSISVFEDEPEARSLAYIIMEEIGGISKRELIINPEREMKSIETIKECLLQLRSGTPIQYIIGREEFYGRSFAVSPAVLIPRGETEELVHMALSLGIDGRVLDIGTGSGAIAITLALESSKLSVEGCDISYEALSQASVNRDTLGADVKLFHCDILSDDIESGYSLIISNPPYIRESERALMRSKVYDHEPEGALFVDDSDPLIFYRVIAEKSIGALDSGGWLLFEINEAMGDKMVDMLSAMGYVDITLERDLLGRDRMVRCRKG